MSPNYLILTILKFQIPISKSQTNPKFQFSNDQNYFYFAVLNFGNSILFGICDLGFGICSVISNLLMTEVPHPGKNHSDIVFVGGSDHLIIPDRSSGLNDRYGARLRRRIHAIPEGKHRIGGQHRSLR